MSRVYERRVAETSLLQFKVVVDRQQKKGIIVRKKMTACAAAMACIAMASPASSGTAQPPPGTVTIGSVRANGSGCPAGTATVNMALDNTAFTVTYSQYIAQVGAGIPLQDFRKNCQVNFQVLIPQGFTYAITKADYRGYASLARGALAAEGAGYYFGGYSQTVYKEHNLRGPFEGNWQFTDETPWTALVFHRCGDRPLFNINTQLRTARGTSSPAATSMMTMDSTDASISTVYHLAWKRC